MSSRRLGIADSAHARRDEMYPGKLFLRENVSVGRKPFRIVQASSGDVDFVRTLVIFVGQGSATRAAEGAVGAGVGLVAPRLSFFPGELRRLYRNPSHGLSAGRPPTIGTMAIGLKQNRPIRPKPHPAAITASGN